MVVGVDGDRALPVNVSIYQGEFARFLLVFDPIDFICNENDFTTSDDDVAITMEEGADNSIRVSVDSGLSVGTEVGISFRGQLFMIVTVAGYPRTIDAMTVTQESGTTESNEAFANFTFPRFQVGDYLEISVNYGNLMHATLVGSFPGGGPINFTNPDAPEGFPTNLGLFIYDGTDPQNMLFRFPSTTPLTGGDFITVEVTKWLHDGVVVFPGII